MRTVLALTTAAILASGAALAAPDLADYAGKYPSDAVDGTVFLKHPAVVAGVEQAVRDAAIRGWVLSAGHGPVADLRQRGRAPLPGLRAAQLRRPHLDDPHPHRDRRDRRLLPRRRRDGLRPVALVPGAGRNGDAGRRLPVGMTSLPAGFADSPLVTRRSHRYNAAFRAARLINGHAVAAPKLNQIRPTTSGFPPLGRTESKMPKMKTKSGAKKRFKVTAHRQGAVCPARQAPRHDQAHQQADPQSSRDPGPVQVRWRQRHQVLPAEFGR